MPLPGRLSAGLADVFKPNQSGRLTLYCGRVLEISAVCGNIQIPENTWI